MIYRMNDKALRSKAFIFFAGCLFLLAGCGYELPKATNGGVSAPQTNQNAAGQSANRNAVPTVREETDAGGEGKLILSGTSETRNFPCQNREVEVLEEATANSYNLTGECKKVTVDGVSNEVKVEKVGEIVVKGTSNKVAYGEGLGGKKPKISKSGTSTSVDSLKALEEKKQVESK
jgi:hypothetical protein